MHPNTPYSGVRHPLFAVWLPLVAVICFSIAAFITIQRNVDSVSGRKDLLEGDTSHYLDIAKSFAAGDFSMSYVWSRPHRQPLYPLLLTPVFRWGNGDLRGLAMVNVALEIATFLLIYYGLLRRFRSVPVAAVVGLLYLINPFMWAHATRHLLTEPLHVFLMMGVLFAFLEYLSFRRLAALLVASAFVGLDYLTRPNGLFVFASMTMVVVLNEVWRLVREVPESRRAGGIRLARNVALAMGLFVLIAAPSWIPRLAYFGNPIHHGYLSNYLWTDTYAQGHVGQRYATYTAKDYFSTHGASDVVQRWIHGMTNCFFRIPYCTEENRPILFILAAGGLLMGLRKGEGMRAFVLLGVLQMLPLVWTNLSNPTIRVPYAASLPFEIILAGYCLSRVPGMVGARFPRSLRTGKREPSCQPAA